MSRAGRNWELENGTRLPQPEDPEAAAVWERLSIMMQAALLGLTGPAATLDALARRGLTRTELHDKPAPPAVGGVWRTVYTDLGRRVAAHGRAQR